MEHTETELSLRIGISALKTLFGQRSGTMRMSDLFQFPCRCRSYLACHAGVFFGRTDVFARFRAPC